MTKQVFKNLHEANVARDLVWNDTGQKLPLSFRGCELAGEAGEACNVIKKLEREALGIRGSRDTQEHLVEELCDVIICAYLIGLVHLGTFSSFEDALSIRTAAETYYFGEFNAKFS